MGIEGRGAFLLNSSEKFKKLQEENARLQELVGKDYLTGLYTHQAVERLINELLDKNKEGTLLVIDVDHFKRINERYGHSNGDAVLGELARLLQQIFFSKDIIGRIGGDEFVVFTTPTHSTQFVVDKGERVIQQLIRFGEQMKLDFRISVTMGAAQAQPGDRYESLFSRADRALASGRRRGGAVVSMAQSAAEAAGEERGETGGAATAIGKDVEIIWRDLREAGSLKGAYCQGYHNFTCIYRFVERGLVRSPSSVYAILLTLTDGNGELIPVDLRDPIMGLLSDIICNSLRLGDVYTQYSSCQFLLMVLDTNRENAMNIVERIRRNLKDSVPEHGGFDIDCAVHPLQSVLKKELEAAQLLL